MGNFYANYTIKGASQKAVADAFAGRNAVIAPEALGCVVVYDEASDMMNSVDEELGTRLSGDLSCGVLGMSNHDDDVLVCQLFQNGEKADGYNSDPDYFDMGAEAPAGPSGGRAEILCRAFGSDSVARVAEILDGAQYVFAFERHQDLVKALGISDHAVGFGHRFISAGELPEGLAADDLTTTA